MLVGRRCVAVKDTRVPFGFRAFDSQGNVADSQDVSRVARAATVSRGATLEVMERYRDYKPPGGLPPNVDIVRIEIVADTSDAPKGATGVKCAVAGDQATSDLWSSSNGKIMNSVHSCSGSLQPNVARFFLFVVRSLVP